MTDIQLPALGESVTEGTITRWLKAVGDEVAIDEPIVEVSTDKVDTEVPSPVAGTITELLAAEDDTVEVGTVIARVGDAGAAPAEDAPSEAAPVEDAGEDPATQEAAAEEAPAQQSAEQPAPAAEAPAEAQEANSEAEDIAREAQAEEAPAEAAPAEAAQDSAAEAAPAAGGATPSGGGGEAADITLPALGESVTEGTITRWLKAVGDEVAVDEPIVEVSTDKVDTEVPSPVAGTLSEILAQEDETIDVGAVIARVGGSGSAAEAPAAEAPAAEEPAAEEPAAEAPAAAEPAAEAAEPEAAALAAAPAQPAAPTAAPAQPTAPAQPAAPAEPAATAPKPAASSAGSTGAAVYVTPIVRKLASERGVDLATVKGTGVGGRIRKEDILAAASATPAAAGSPATTPAAAEPVQVSALRGTQAPMSRLRKVVAKRAVESMQQLAQLTTVVEVDVTKVAALRDAKKAAFLEETGHKLTFLPFFTLAAVEALKSHPIINSTDDGEQITYPDSENLSMAVDTERGLLTPVVRNAGDKSIRELVVDIADLAQRTRDNKLSPDELAGGTFTLTNTGSRGALFDTPVVFQPQRAILGVGSVVKRAVVVTTDGQDAIAIRSMVYLALSYDHRIIDGADAARYLGQVKARLEQGAFEV